MATSKDALLGVELGGRFRLDELLGEGGMGRVYRATQLSVDRTVAVKVMREEHAESTTVKQRFLREAKAVAAFSHPSIVRLIDFGEDPTLGVLYLAMDHISGDCLASVVGSGRLRDDVALCIIARLASGLHEAHAAGIVHRDLKPDNVMLSRAADGRVQPLILDFGVALPQEVSVRLTEDGRVCGTPAYMAPEQARAQDVGPPADLYALGVILFEMLTNELPVSGPNPMSVMVKKLQNPPPRLEDVLNPGETATDGLESLVADLLEREPAERLQSAGELVRRIEAILGSGDFSIRVTTAHDYTDWFLGPAGAAFAPTVIAARATAAPLGETLSGASLARARQSCLELQWALAVAAYEDAQPAAPDDLIEYGRCLYMLGRDDDFVDAYSRAYDAFMAAGNHARAAWTAFWIGQISVFRGQMPVAGAWFARAQRALEDAPEGCVEHGWFRVSRAGMQWGQGNHAAAVAIFGEASAIAEEHRDLDLMTIAGHLKGHVLLEMGEIGDGLAAIDEAMLGMASGRVSPMVMGLTYCAAIAGCHSVLALGRTRQWTQALSTWCEGQPSLVSFTGKCLVHRAEVMRVTGEWDLALEEAERACQRFEAQDEVSGWARAWYERAEVYRLRGQFGAAEAAYQTASDLGRDPQPGLALLRMTQGDATRALASIRRVRASTLPGLLANVLSACVEIALAADEHEEARGAAEELTALAEAPGREVVAAMGAYASAAVQLGTGDAEQALREVDRAHALWTEIGAPFEVARCRLLKSQACAALQDLDGAELERRAAKRTYDHLGAHFPD